MTKELVEEALFSEWEHSFETNLLLNGR